MPTPTYLWQIARTEASAQTAPIFHLGLKITRHSPGTMLSSSLVIGLGLPRQSQSTPPSQAYA